MKRIISSAVMVYFLLVLSSLMAEEIAVEPGNQTGVYKSGEEASLFPFIPAMEILEISKHRCIVKQYDCIV